MPSSVAAQEQQAVEPSPLRTVVHKFGGTSVADAERDRHVAQLLRARDEDIQVAVVSAMRGVTDALIDLSELASRNQDEWRDRWHELRARHRGAAVALLNENAGPTLEWLDERFAKLSEILGALAVIGELPREVLDRVQGLGEVCSARLLGDYFRAQGDDCAVLDARDVLVVDRSDLGVEVDWAISASRLADWRTHHQQRRIVVTGFVARDRANRITTLGRNGSATALETLKKVLSGAAKTSFDDRQMVMAAIETLAQNNSRDAEAILYAVLTTPERIRLPGSGAVTADDLQEAAATALLPTASPALRLRLAEHTLRPTTPDMTRLPVTDCWRSPLVASASSRRRASIPARCPTWRSPPSASPGSGSPGPTAR